MIIDMTFTQFIKPLLEIGDSERRYGKRQTPDWGKCLLIHIHFSEIIFKREEEKYPNRNISKNVKRQFTREIQ